MDDPPEHVRLVAAEWDVVLTERTHTRYSQTWFGLRGDDHVVLKVGDAAARRREATALRIYAVDDGDVGFAADGRATADAGAPQSRDANVACLLLAERPGALLLERILLGDDLRPLAEVDDDAATAIAGTTIARMQCAITPARPLELPELREVRRSFDQYWARIGSGAGDPPLPEELVARAHALLVELSAPAATDTLLHGDAHHQNVIRQGFGGPDDVWRVIDPHGWWGDPTFDAVALMLNLHGSLAMSRTAATELRARAQRRAAILAETAGLDPARLLAWTFVGGIVAELWCLADHGFVQGGPLKLAAALRDGQLA